MLRKSHHTRCGDIVYWVNHIKTSELTLIFLPGLTADHRLFDKQLEYFESKYSCLVWDAPAHNESRPFTFDFDLKDKAIWLDEIIDKEKIKNPVIVGQSMGGYVGQMYSELYGKKLKGFISIDSAPLQRSYVSSFDLWFMENAEPMYRYYPWKALVRDGAKGTAYTPYGQELMEAMIKTYDHKYYSKLAGHGYGLLAGAYKANLKYEFECPVLILCGDKDKAGLTKNYNKRWAKKTGHFFEMIPGAGHNSNSDQPDMVNLYIDEFVKKI